MRGIGFLIVTISLGFSVGCSGNAGSKQTSGNREGDHLAASDADVVGDVAGTDYDAAHTGGVVHADNMAGVMHASGKTDPLNSCVSCHGASLQGGTGPSCYTCHDAADHTSVRGGVHHRSGSSSSCATCHGPGNGGGLGPACSDCH